MRFVSNNIGVLHVPIGMRNNNLQNLLNGLGNNNNNSNNNSNNSIFFYNETVELNFESNLIIGTSEYKNYLLSNLDDLIKNKNCSNVTFSGYEDEFQNISSNYEFFFCNKSQTLDRLNKIISSLYFYSSELNTTFEIEKDILLKENGNNTYINIIFNKDEEKSNKWILGKPFSFKYQLIFNSNSGTIAFYNKFKKIKNDTENHIVEKKSKDTVYKLLIIIPLIIYICAGPIIVAIKQLMNKKQNEDNEEEKIGILNEEGNEDED